jgi:phosphoglycolate phosphatase-like HAD superfamily hydrolase
VQSFSRLGWSNYFLTINADLENKSVAFDKIMNDFAYPKNACLSVGDTRRDFAAAIESGIGFWRIKSHPNEDMALNDNSVGDSIDFFALINYLT